MPAATDMARQPYDSRSSVSEKQRVIGSQIAERLGQEFRTYGFDVRTFFNVVLQKIVEGVCFRDMPREEESVGFLLHPLEQHIQSALDVANKAEIDRSSSPDMSRVLVNLDFFHFLAR